MSTNHTTVIFQKNLLRENNFVFVFNGLHTEPLTRLNHITFCSLMECYLIVREFKYNDYVSHSLDMGWRNYSMLFGISYV